MDSILNARALRAAGFGFLVCLLAAPLVSARGAGRISGVVLDSGGTPQMGATVLLSSESALRTSSVKLLTDGRGRFSSAALPVGLYTVEVTLGGFLPAIQRNIRVTGSHPTVLQIMLGTIFSSLAQLRRSSGTAASADDWTWALRSATESRSVLRWQDAGLPIGVYANPAEASGPEPIRGGVMLTSGADHPGSIADTPDSTATAVVYDLDLGSRGHVLMAGQFSYDEASSSAGIAGEWLPSGGPGAGPVSTILVRESKIGPNGPVFRGLRMAHDDQFMVGDRVSIRYGAELLMAGFSGTTTAVRPHGEVAVQIDPSWEASATIATSPWDDAATEGTMQSAADALDSFPTLLVHHGEPVFENDLHEEVAVEHQLSSRSNITAAVFHDASGQTAVIGRGAHSGPDFVQNYFSQVFAYDGGESSSTGARVAYRDKVNSNLSTEVVYAYAGALAPIGSSDSTEPLRDRLATRYRQSVAARASTKIPRLGTELTAGYKWIDGATVSRLDPYGESLYNLDPYVSLQIRQPLPNVFPCHMEMQADIGNLLAQGYVQVATPAGYVVLVPAYRYIRGGVSFQF